VMGDEDGVVVGWGWILAHDPQARLTDFVCTTVCI
jgi:hypothetical protein